MEKGGPVTTGGFDAEGWVVGLTTAITELAEIQHGHWTELEAQRQARSERDRTGWSPWGQKVHELSSFYGRASSEGAYFERNYGPLCDALKKARRALAAHPVLERVGEPVDWQRQVDDISSVGRWRLQHDEHRRRTGSARQRARDRLPGGRGGVEGPSRHRQ